MEAGEGTHHDNIQCGMLPMASLVREYHVVDDEFRIAWFHGLDRVAEYFPRFAIVPICEHEMEVVSPGAWDY